MIAGDKIKIERIKRGLSQEDLGNILGVTKVSICGYEKGTRTPTLETFERIIETLDLTPDELLGRDVHIVGENEEPYQFMISNQELSLIIALRNDKDWSSKVYKELEKRNKDFN